jgi:hypothetical protein
MSKAKRIGAMTYRKCDFGKELLAQLEKGYDPDRIARWANEQHLNHAGEMEAELRSEIQTVMAMEGEPQFHLSEKELRKLAARLMES